MRPRAIKASSPGERGMRPSAGLVKPRGEAKAAIGEGLVTLERPGGGLGEALGRPGEALQRHGGGARKAWGRGKHSQERRVSETGEARKGTLSGDLREGTHSWVCAHADPHCPS